MHVLEGHVLRVHPLWCTLTSVRIGCDAPARALLLQTQMDGLFELVEQRDSLRPGDELQTAGPGAGGPLRRGLVADGLGFKILLVGDSTVRVRHTWGDTVGAP